MLLSHRERTPCEALAHELVEQLRRLPLQEEDLTVRGDVLQEALQAEALEEPL